MSTTTRITVSTLVNKTIARVWNCWTDPTHIKHWNAASDDWHCPKASNDLRIGGAFSSTMAARDGSFSFDFAGVYDDVQDPGSRPGQGRIAYTLPDGRTCEVLFVEENDGTRVTEYFDSESQNPVEMQRSGWQAILDRFKAHTEAQA
ncbi:MAG: SRPBCC family protein [Flavobacteriales bacterium]